jgi:hypothetical protein
MNAYKTYAEVDSSGRLVLDRLPFQEGALLEIVIIEQSRQPEERVSSWQALMRHVQGLPQSSAFSDEDIEAEVDKVRSTRESRH